MKNQRREMRVWLLATIVSLAGCARSPEETREVITVVMKPDPVAEQYAVYSALLNEFHSGPDGASRVKPIVVNDETSVDTVSGFSPEQIFQNHEISLSPAFHSALKDYEAKNKESEQLISSFKLDLDYLFLS